MRAGGGKKLVRGRGEYGMMRKRGATRELKVKAKEKRTEGGKKQEEARNKGSRRSRWSKQHHDVCGESFVSFELAPKRDMRISLHVLSAKGSSQGLLLPPYILS
eukprot:767555-Hanusia_phi.AAC.2